MGKAQHGSQIIVIGAGPAGLMAAIRAASLGSAVLLLEKMPDPGRKLLITGSGRCNLTNAADLASFIGQFFGQGRFLYPAFSRFFRPELINLLAAQGVLVITEPSGKIFPASNKASDVLAALLKLASENGVRIQTKQAVKAIHCHNGRIIGVSTDHADYPATAVILAAGGKSWPKAGSAGDGFLLAQSLGHHLTPVRPGLVPFVVDEKWVHSLSGLACPSVRAVLLKNGRPAGQEQGELLWTHFGLSGPVILRLSRAKIPDEIPQANEGEKPIWEIQLDLLPGHSESAILACLNREIAAKPRQYLKNALDCEGLVPKALLLSLLPVCQIPPEQTCAQTSKRQLSKLAETIKKLILPIKGTRGYQESMVTAGGIKLGEVDPKTMASRLISGLYLAGEVLDLDGDTGGFNLQAAFSTGFLAGDFAARYCREASNP